MRALARAAGEKATTGTFADSAAFDSLGEQPQRALPETKVVKTLKHRQRRVMVNPAKVGNGAHDVFVSGNDAAAKPDASRSPEALP